MKKITIILFFLATLVGENSLFAASPNSPDSILVHPLLSELNLEEFRGDLQGPGTPCNNQSRTAEITAGMHNKNAPDCASITFSVGVVSYSTPATCTESYSFYGGTIYACQSGSNGNHCIAEGFTVPLTIASGGGCPNLSGLDITQWDNWRDVPKAVASALACTPPRKTETQDWSAKVKKCVDGVVVIECEDTMVEGGSGDEYYCFIGETAGTYAMDASTNPFHSPYDLEQDNTFGFLGLLGLVQASHSPFAGVQVSAKVKIEHFDAESTIAFNTGMEGFTGKVIAGGEFEMTRASVVPVEGVPEIALEKVWFDGFALVSKPIGAEAGNIFPLEYQRFDDLFRLKTTSVEPLYWWAYDPYQLPHFAGVAYSESMDSETGFAILTREISSDGGDYIGSEILVDDTTLPAHPIRQRVFNSIGGITEEVSYENYLEVQTGSWRPSKVIRTVFLDGVENGRRIIVTTTILEARVLNSTEILDVPTLPTSDYFWQLWQ